MKKWSFVALLLVGAAILGATVLREPVAIAAGNLGVTIAGPLDATGNVKVHEQGTANTREQNTDTNGFIKVHEQGTATVSGTIGLSPTANTVKLDPSNSEVKVGNSAANPVPVHSVDSESSTHTLYAVGTLVPAGVSFLQSPTIDLDGFENARVSLSIENRSAGVSAAVLFGPFPSNGFARTSVTTFGDSNILHIDSPVWGPKMVVAITNNSSEDWHVQGYVYAVR